MYTTQRTVTIIGAGPSGLAAAYHLQQAGIDYQVIEASDIPGSSWRYVPDDFRLLQPLSEVEMPGLDQVISYLNKHEKANITPKTHLSRAQLLKVMATYAKIFNLNIQFNTAVTQVSKANDSFSIEMKQFAITALANFTYADLFKLKEFCKHHMPSNHLLFNKIKTINLAEKKWQSLPFYKKEVESLIAFLNDHNLSQLKDKLSDSNCLKHTQQIECDYTLVCAGPRTAERFPEKTLTKKPHHTHSRFFKQVTQPGKHLVVGSGLSAASIVETLKQTRFPLRGFTEKEIQTLKKIQLLSMKRDLSQLAVLQKIQAIDLSKNDWNNLAFTKKETNALINLLKYKGYTTLAKKISDNLTTSNVDIAWANRGDDAFFSASPQHDQQRLEQLKPSTAGVTNLPRLAGQEKNDSEVILTFGTGEEQQQHAESEYDKIIYATGYTRSFPYLTALLPDAGNDIPQHTAGNTNVDNLYLVGMPGKDGQPAVISDGSRDAARIAIIIQEKTAPKTTVAATPKIG